jgi:hypothetical protein
MNLNQELVDKWIVRLAESHPEQSGKLCAPDPDPFRNPVGYAMRKSLAQLWAQLQGDMDADEIEAALDTVLRIRALQDISPSEAAGFVVQLRPVLRQMPTTLDLVLLESRIDQLTLAAFDKYVQCREQIVAVRQHETERLTRTYRATAEKART